MFVGWNRIYHHSPWIIFLCSLVALPFITISGCLTPNFRWSNPILANCFMVNSQFFMNNVTLGLNLYFSILNHQFHTHFGYVQFFHIEAITSAWLPKDLPPPRRNCAASRKFARRPGGNATSRLRWPCRCIFFDGKMEGKHGWNRGWMGDEWIWRDISRYIWIFLGDITGYPLFSDVHSRGKLP